MAAAISSSRLSEQPGGKEEETSQPGKEPQGEAPTEGGPQELPEEQPLLPHSDKNGSREPGEAEQAVMGNGTSEQALQQESDKADKGEKDAGGAGRAAAEPLSWGTRIAQKLFIQVCRCSHPCCALHAGSDMDKQLSHACHDGSGVMGVVWSQVKGKYSSFLTDPNCACAEAQMGETSAPTAGAGGCDAADQGG